MMFRDEIEVVIDCSDRFVWWCTTNWNDYPPSPILMERAIWDPKKMKLIDFVTGDEYFLVANSWWSENMWPSGLSEMEDMYRGI